MLEKGGKDGFRGEADSWAWDLIELTDHHNRPGEHMTRAGREGALVAVGRNGHDPRAYGLA